MISNFPKMNYSVEKRSIKFYISKLICPKHPGGLRYFQQRWSKLPVFAMFLPVGGQGSLKGETLIDRSEAEMTVSLVRICEF